MSSLFNIAFPIFALIGIGFLCRRFAILSGNASSELSRYVVYLALPALLFDATSHLRVADFSNSRFILAFFLGMVVVVAMTVAIRVSQRVHLVDATIEGLGAGYANTGFIGIPLCLLAFGQDSLAPAVIATVMTACLLFAMSIVMVEISLHAGHHVGQAVMKVTASLLRNPLVLAPAAGALFAFGGITLPQGGQQVFKLLGASAGPCALVSLGLFLAQPAVAAPAAAARRSPLLVVLLKLIGQPLVTALLVYQLLELPRMWADTAFLLSALPVGTGPFMLAEKYGREASVVSRAILLSTIGSLGTISLILAWIAGR